MQGSCPYRLSDYSFYITPAKASIGRERHWTVPHESCTHSNGSVWTLTSFESHSVDPVQAADKAANNVVVV